MKESDVPATDSGYPTPRDDLPPSSRSASPSSPSPDENLLTSTPIRGSRIRSKQTRFSNFHPELSIIESTSSDSISPANDSNYVLDGVKSFLSASKELKKKARENSALRGENETLRGENESLREENFSLREESRRFEMDRSVVEERNVFPIVPKLELDSINRDSIPDSQLKSSEKIKKELLSFIKNENERTIVESKMENMLISDSNPPAKVFTATATIQVDIDKMDADVQTETDNVNVVNANWQIEVDQLKSQIEVLEKKKEDEMKNRLFDFEETKAKFEEDQLKLRSDLEKKLKKSQEANTKQETKIEELQARLNRRKKDLEEVQAENRKLLEDKSTQGFELDEMKIHGELLEKQKVELEEKIEQLKEKISDLEEKLQSEKTEKLNVEKEAEKRSSEQKALTLELKKQASDAMKVREEALEKLKEAETESKNILKENQYLTQAQQVFIDSEMNLKSEVSVLTADLKNAETQVTQLKARVEEEKHRRKKLVEENAHLEGQNKKLLGEKFESSELLDELKKGKLEIDHLRQQVQHLSRDNEEMFELKKELEETVQREKKMKEKMEQTLKKEGELEARLEGYIRSEAAAVTELDRLKEEAVTQKVTLDDCLSELKNKESIAVNLERVYEELRTEFEEFRTHANAQYEHDISVRDEQIEHLRVRLLELETYPGQTISVSKRSQEVQTDDVKPDYEKSPSPVQEVVSPEISLVSAEVIPDHLVRLEENIKSMITKMKEVVQEQQIDETIDLQVSPLHLSTETFRKFAEILESQLTGSEEEYDATSDEIRCFWTSLNQQIRDLTTTLEDRFESARVEYDRKGRRNEQKLKEHIEKLKDGLAQAQALADQRAYIATQFKEQYEMEEREKEELRVEYERLVELRNDDNAEFERNERSLRQRLERAEHDLQSSTRNKLNKTEEYEAELEHLTATLKKLEADHSQEMATEKRKRAYERMSTQKSMEFCNILKEKAEYLKQRNSDRQRLINHMMKFAKASKLSRDETETSRQYADLKEHVTKSGLLKLNEQEIAPVSEPCRVSENDPL